MLNKTQICSKPMTNLQLIPHFQQQLTAVNAGDLYTTHLLEKGTDLRCIQELLVYRSLNIKSSGKISMLRLTAWLSTLVSTAYSSSRSKSIIIRCPRSSKFYAVLVLYPPYKVSIQTPKK